MELKTKRLGIIPLSINQMEQLCEWQNKLNSALGSATNNNIKDGRLHTAYSEIYNNCVAHPDDYL